MTDKKQTDLFADDHGFIGALFDKLDDIPDAELQDAWSGVLLDLIAVIRAELKRQGKSDDKLADKLVGVIANYMGGRALYLPRGERIQEVLRDYQIYDEFDGKNHRTLAQRYNLSEPHIYAIIRKQLALRRRRYQRELAFE